MNSKYLKPLIFMTTLTFSIILTTHKVNASPQASILRSEVEQRATTIMDLSWTYSPLKNSTIDSTHQSMVTLPKQFENVATAQFIGIPYNWGGMDGLCTHSFNAPWTNFLDAINKGAFAGNVNTNTGYGYVPRTAGIDCSGFVQAAFNIIDSKQSTYTLLQNYFNKIDLKGLKHMDILDKPGSHVVIFDKWGTLNGEEGAFTYESTTNQSYGGIQGTKRYFMGMKKIVSGYIPARYINILDSPIAPNFEVGSSVQVSGKESYGVLRINSSANNAIITTIPKNTILKLISYSNGWFKVTYGGKTGWILQSSLNKIPAGKYVTIKGTSRLNIRKNPSVRSSIAGILTKERYATRIGASADGKWYKISVNGIQGWCFAKYLIYK